MTERKSGIGTAKVLARVVLAGVIVAALMLAGCSAKSASQAADPKQDRRVMLETAAKFYVASGAQDIEATKKLVHDPENIMGLATATPPGADAETTTVRWAWNGGKIVLSAESDETTYTLSSSDASPSVVTLSDSTGADLGELIMKKVDGTWRIDVSAVQKAADAAAKSPEGQKQECWSNQQNIEDSAYAFDQETGKFPKTIAQLVPDYMDNVPVCPTTAQPYIMNGKGIVAPCAVHGHYPPEGF